MNETLESLLEMLCKTTVKSQQNAQQTLYLLTDPKDAKLIYDMLVAIGLDTKYYPEDNMAKLYVQNASVAAHADKIAQLIETAPFYRDIKGIIDQQPHLGDYSISLSTTQAGRQLTIFMPQEKTSKSPVATAANARASAAPKQRPSARTKAQPTEDDALLTGPAVARTAIPKQFQTSATDEDPLSKRIMFYLSAKSFTSGAWAMFVLLILGIVFSIMVTIRGFLCPDVATTQADVPSYCPQKIQRSE